MNRNWLIFKRLPTKFKVFFFLLIMMLLALHPSTIPQAIHDSPHHSKYGGTLVWGTINTPTIINPVVTSHSVSSALLGLLFDSLVRFDSQGKIVPGLAQSWKISEDGLRYTFYLRSGVYFHDRVECTAEDIKFTYESISNPENKSHWRNSTEMIQEWKVIDRYTIEVILERPVADILQALTREILPQHLYKKTNLLSNSYNFSPVGTGPFRFHQWERSSNEIILLANKNYFEGRPYLDKIIVKTYKNNSDLWAALMRGEVDFVKYLNKHDYEVLSKDPAFKTYKTNSGTNFAIIFNTHDPLLQSREIRRAINYAIDRKDLMQSSNIGGIESNGPFYPESPWFNPEVEAATYNPQLAQKILAQHGWKLGPEGLLQKKGQLLILTMLVDRNRGYFYHMARHLRQQLSEVGIGLKIVFYDKESQLTPEYLAETKAQMWLRMFVSGKDDEPSDMARSWYSRSSEFARLWSYEDKEIDQLYEKGRGLKDDAQRAPLYQKIHVLIDRDQPACFLFFSEVYHAVSTKVKNTDNVFTDFMQDYLIKEWTIVQ